MALLYDTLRTPVGPFTFCVEESGALTGAVFGGLEALRARLKNARAFRPAPNDGVRKAVHAYFAGELRVFPFDYRPAGTPFQQRVWAALQQIPHGQTRSYREIARELGAPTATRAVGQANGANPLCLFIPCHRVIAANGTLGGFAFGVEIKKRLLALESGT